MLLVQVFLAFQTFTRITNQIWMYSKFKVSLPWVPKWLSLDSREWLAGEPNCTGTHYGDTFGPVPGAKTCGTLYMILSGQQTLLSFMDVERLTHLLFSFSGGPFLLIVR